MKFFLLAVLLLVSSASAQRFQDALDLYANGDFLKASLVARQFQTAEGFAFAARSLYEHAMELPISKRESLMIQCEKFARDAIALDANNADAYFELGASAGQFALLRGATWAFLNGIPSQIRGYFEKTLELDPRHVFAMIALARWHAEVVVGGGGFIYAASPEVALNLLNRAVRFEPKNINVRVNFAQTLMVLDKVKNRAAAKAQLEIAIILEPRDALERKALVAAQRGLESLR
jgi:tetratricopeptide (TPR) repeat protein